MEPEIFYASTAIPLDADPDYVIPSIVVRPHPASVGQLQALITSMSGLQPLLGADSRTGFSLGEQITLFEPSAGPEVWPRELGPPPEAPAWDPWSQSTYFVYGSEVMRLSGDTVTLVAGNKGGIERVDGAGPEARFTFTHFTRLAPDGAGCLFVACDDRIRRIQLPAAWQASTSGPEGQMAPGGGAGGSSDSGRESGLPAEVAHALVSTLPYTAPAPITGVYCVLKQPGMANEYGSRGCSGQRSWLVFHTHEAVYRLPLSAARAAAGAAAGPPLPDNAAGRGAPGTTAGVGVAPLQPELLAGRTGARGVQDGRGADARFACLAGGDVDATGSIYLCDRLERSLYLRRLSPDGSVCTLIDCELNEHECGWGWPTILPNGYIAAATDEKLHLFDLGLQLPESSAAAAAKAAAAAAAAMKAAAAGLPPPRSLPADLGALLDAQPDGAADLVIHVGERRFAVHRAILSARCDYFKQRLAASGGFADGRAAELELPDADPDAFALLLRWLYTGGADIPLERVHGVAELADRLLLPELCAAAQDVVVASVDATTIVDSLLWAAGCCESRGGSFTQLLARLKGWYVSHHEEVAAEAGDSRKRLAMEAPGLLLELVDAMVRPQQQQQEPDGRDRKRSRRA
ncbi:hypothetical protein HYH02_003054 [Chlamydomonas schloesseri]|uniref:BTB domain-containing protein n=1 Tax=Chlamydomonas schloesseri TaxID=2026947 RepID=A0A835WR84_9CHLO|nr:hypothetical protein HYH02_003054 [Chlamydomonas schloesseri]|eukprot:KAG2452012.1 hypothetical protein HYH02_003054 [Chlamydomonas schloesseri]